MDRQHRHIQRLTVAAAVALVPLATACGTEPADGGSAGAPPGVHRSAGGVTADGDVPLRGTRWTVTALGAHGTATAPPANADAHLTFDRRTGKVVGRLGCNHVSARATVRDARITLGSALTTRMMCDASLMHTEKSLLRFFGGTVSYRIDQRTLTLTSQNGETVTAEAKM
ncbi:META domain-containing protein [Streptomyces sp. NPDC086787]|uniref:META domain-containing protein n=1 Tax=Streptomyces sp. NPDC086787 TaxID=3365759 RepID=UPI0038036F42